MKKDTSTKICQTITSKIAIKNILIFYSLAKLYRLATVSELSLRCTERCFPILVETQNFSHLYFNLVAKILATSELNIHSEVKVLHMQQLLGLNTTLKNVANMQNNCY